MQYKQTIEVFHHPSGVSLFVPIINMVLEDGEEITECSEWRKFEKVIDRFFPDWFRK